MTEKKTNDGSGHGADVSSVKVREGRAASHLQMTTVDATIATALIITEPKIPTYVGD